MCKKTTICLLVSCLGLGTAQAQEYKPSIHGTIRGKYEKYFYDEGAKIKTSEHDKLVAELMVRF